MTKFAVLLCSLMTLAAHAQPERCAHLFPHAESLLAWGLNADKLTSLWSEGGEKERGYLQASAQLGRLLKSAPKEFYAILAVVSPLSQHRKAKPLSLSERLKTPASEIAEYWHDSGLDLVAEVMQQSHPDWYEQFLKAPTPEMQDLLIEVVAHIRPVSLVDSPTTRDFSRSLQQVIADHGLDAGRVQDLMTNSRYFRNQIVMAAFIGALRLMPPHNSRAPELQTAFRLAEYFQKNPSSNVLKVPSELQSLYDLIERLALWKMNPQGHPQPAVPAGLIPLLPTFFATLEKTTQICSKAPAKVVVSTLAYLKTDFTRQREFATNYNEARQKRPHLLVRSLIDFFKRGQTNSGRQLPFLLATFTSLIVAAPWPASIDVEADLLESFSDQIRAL